jgi:hypothetical protein
MCVFQAKNFMTVGAIEMHVVFGMCFVGAVVSAHRKSRNAVGAYDLVHNARFFKIFQYTV